MVIFFVTLINYVSHYLYLHAVQPSLRCTLLHPHHPCLLLPDRGSNFSLPQILPVDTVITEFDVSGTFSVISSLRGSFPDGCLDVVQRTLCILAAPPCDPMSVGLPMQFCERDCVAYKMLNEKSACDGLVEFVSDFAESLENIHVIQGIKIFEMFDCNNVTTYHFFESDNYAETCTGLLSKQSRGE